LAAVTDDRKKAASGFTTLSSVSIPSTWQTKEKNKKGENAISKITHGVKGFVTPTK